MVAVLIIPTGVGAEIGGHAGDGNPVAKLLAACCDTLITHPNVVNASDINEMPANAWYVEGSILDRFLRGEHRLYQAKRPNRILVVVNKMNSTTLNAVSAARCTIGADVQIIELETALIMHGRVEAGIACGDVSGVSGLAHQLKGCPLEFDALAVHTPIDVRRDVALAYYRKGGVNPWGGVEAKASKMIAKLLNKPVAHAPLENVGPDDSELYNIFEESIDPRIAAEALSHTYLHCVLKGLHRAPRPTHDYTLGIERSAVDFLITPDGCFGPAHEACIQADIPIIVVAENTTTQKYDCDFLRVENYWEAAGLLMCARAGVSPWSVRRPVLPTELSHR